MFELHEAATPSEPDPDPNTVPLEIVEDWIFGIGTPVDLGSSSLSEDESQASSHSCSFDILPYAEEDTARACCGRWIVLGDEEVEFGVLGRGKMDGFRAA